MPPNFSSSDAWVLHALTLAGGTVGTELKRLVFTGDGIEHAVFEAAELADCLGRLLSAGLVVRTNDGFAVTPVVAERIKRGGLTRQREKAERLVRRARTEELPVSSEAPSEAECREAIESYKAMAKETINRAV